MGALMSVLILIFILFLLCINFYNFFKAINFLWPIDKLAWLYERLKKPTEKELMKEEILNVISDNAAKQFTDATITEPAVKTTLEDVLVELAISDNTYKLIMSDQDSYHELRRKAIFKHASEALKYHKVNKVALMAGYSVETGPRSFTKMFKKINNITPSEFKRKLSSSDIQYQNSTF